MRRIAKQRTIARSPRPVGHDASIRQGAARRDPLQGGLTPKTKRDQPLEFPEGRLRHGEAVAQPGGEGGPGLVHGVQPFNFVIV